MEQTSKGWIISNENHPSGTDKYLIHSTFAQTRKESIGLFCKGSGKEWRYWYRKWNFRCVKAEIIISTINQPKP